MTPPVTLALGGPMHGRLKGHLFPGDGLDAAAILLCARCPGPRLKLVARRLVLVPNERRARRERDAVTWPGDYLDEATDLAEPERLVAMLVHSHPGGLWGFSQADDLSDTEVMPCLFAGGGDLHGSAVMILDGARSGPGSTDPTWRGKTSAS